MKLILCPKCSDVVKCGNRVKRYCSCRKSWGKYVDELYAEIGGYAICVCLANSGLVDAIRHQPETGWGHEFKAWVPSRHADHITNHTKDIRKELEKQRERTLCQAFGSENSTFQKE